MNNTETGALTGAGLGAVGGAIVGSAFHRPGVGAAIGAGAGGLTGAAVGNAEDKREERTAAAVQAQAQAQAQARALQLNDVVQLTQQRVPDDIIINQIRTSPTVFRLSGDEVVWLRRNGVSDAVIRELQLTAWRAPRRVYTEVPYDPAVVVVEPAPPPVAVGVGFGYTHYRHW
jgi:hypothetical protein